jgi:hypothetical protein
VDDAQAAGSEREREALGPAGFERERELGEGRSVVRRRMNSWWSPVYWVREKERKRATES